MESPYVPSEKCVRYTAEPSYFLLKGAAADATLATRKRTYDSSPFVIVPKRRPGNLPNFL